MNTQLHSLIVAIASEDGEQMPKGHFGAAAQYEMYEISADSAIWLRSVTNPRVGHEHEHHHGHGDDAKQHGGGGAGRLLGNQGAQIVVSRAFGANIKRMRQRFLPVMVRCEQVKDAIALLQSEWPQVEQHWNQGADRKHLVLR